MVRTSTTGRKGAVLPMFALLLPVLVMLCAFAINIAYIQLTSTELRVATDSAARAGGRAWSEFQNVTDAKSFARQAARRNTVAGAQFDLKTDDSQNEIEFGLSNRTNNGFGRYVFTKQDTSQVASGAVQANAIRINGNKTSKGRTGNISLLFGGVGGTKVFEPIMSSVCTQVDRDIAMVLDKSGSMTYYEDEEALTEAITGLYKGGQISYNDYYYSKCSDTSAGGLYSRFYSSNLRSRLPTDMAQYAADMNDYNGWYWSNYYRQWRQMGAGSDDAPRHSRWDLLSQAVAAFINVLRQTDQEEQLSLALFDSSGYLRHYLETDFSLVQDTVDGTIPYSGTSIGEGMQQAIQTLNAPQARAFAAKTIVVMTDGVNNAGEISPATVATSIVSTNNVTIHTVTFTQGSDQAAMQSVAAIGGGKHYHADEGNALIEIFEEIANNMPTIITD